MPEHLQCKPGHSQFTAVLSFTAPLPTCNAVQGTAVEYALQSAHAAFLSAMCTPAPRSPLCQILFSVDLTGLPAVELLRCVPAPVFWYVLLTILCHT